MGTVKPVGAFFNAGLWENEYCVLAMQTKHVLVRYKSGDETGDHALGRLL